MSDILSKKHEIMVTARQIMDSLREMFGQPFIQIKQEKNVAYSRRFAPSSSQSEKIQKRKERRGKEPLTMFVLLYKKLVPSSSLRRLMEHKSEALEKFKEYKAEVENLLIETAVHILNNVPSKSVSETPFELWRGRKSSLSHFRIWGCPAHVLVTNPKKLEPRSRLCQFVGYPKETRGGLLFDPQENRVVIPDDGVEDPLSYKQAMNDVDKDKWVKAMDLEIESMYFNSLRKLIDLPEGVKPIGCKSIYKRKRDSAGKSIRIPLSIATFYDYEICQMDVKTAFLNGNLKESIFMSQPEEFITQGPEQKKINKGKVAFLVLYVDILLIGNDVGYLTDVKAWLAAQFQMKDLEEAQYVLRIQIIRDRKNKTLALSQTTYINKMLVRYSMQNSKKGLLPFRHGVQLSKEQCLKTPQEVEDMRRIPYASAVGSLMYAMLCTRPDIFYVVEIVSRYQSNPGLDHWTTVKINLKYLRRTRDYMLVYGAKDLILTRYTDFDFQTDKDSKKSTLGSVFTLNGGAVVWRSIKQGCIGS
ncbi:gag/pol protein [Cucumis melo var. makuwa]|uniref:Gag/pol protein n=1 Tax=Cucumis melo var. makuwa TaxID=1194695 RepID=A0A5A7UCA6_CUCMM|nr:gag/pol protein [Cucumis melo var. makuwa]